MRDSDLSRRLGLLVGVFAALFLVFGLLVWNTLERVRVNGPIYGEIVLGKDLIADVLPPPNYIIEAYLLTLQLEDETDSARLNDLIDRGNRLRIDYESRQEFWRRNLEEGSLKDLMTVTSYRPAVEFFRLRDEQFIPALQAGDRQRASAVLAQMQQRYNAHRIAIDDVVKIASERNSGNEAAAAEVIEWRSKVLLVLGVFILLVVAVMAVVAKRTAKDLAERLELASQIAGRVAAGDLTTEVPVSTGSDEASRLLRAIDAMTKSLRGLVARAKQASVELMSTATEFAATSRQQEATVAGFGASTNQIAAAVKQISATSADLLATMEGVNVVAGQTADLATEGQNSLGHLDQTMGRLDAATSNMAARLAAIRDEAAEITGVVTAITRVADQTNMLSINAAIEAEKAGEQGLGFLVLAREIRRLADQTAVATLDIEQMVKQMQSAVSAGVMEIDRFADEVRSGVANVNRVGGQFSQIISQVKVLSERFEAVNFGMRSQSSGARQIGDAMEQLIDGARQTSVSLREFNSATESLRDAVSTLRQEISQFDVGT